MTARLTLLLPMLAMPFLPAADALPEPPWKTNVPIVEVAREVYRKHPRIGAAALVQLEYVGPNLELMEWQGIEVTDDVWDQQEARWSSDNGRTWSKFAPMKPSSNVLYQGVTVWEGGVAREFDPTSGLLVEVWLRQIHRAGLFNCFSYVRTSKDHGRTWGEPKQLRYEDGDGFAPDNPLKPSFLKNNQCYPGSNILRHSNGTLVHCLAHVNAVGDPANDKRGWKLGSVCVVGRWDREAGDYTWRFGKRVEVSAEVSSRGLMEPAVAELTDGRVLTIWRGSNTAKTPGRKWFAVSSDGGLTQSEPAELKYDDGGSFYSPSSYHRFLRHSVTKKLYWVGNICLTPPQGNSPRYPLVIAEVDEAKPALKKKTVTLIDDRRPEQTAAVQYSNFSLIEDRETHELVLHLSTYGQEPKSVYTADNYRYRLKLK